VLVANIKLNTMKITTKLSAELIKEENSLKVSAYFGAFINGDFRYIVALETKKQNLFFQFNEN
jgi:hypothetical protein